MNIEQQIEWYYIGVPSEASDNLGAFYTDFKYKHKEEGWTIVNIVPINEYIIVLFQRITTD